MDIRGSWFPRTAAVLFCLLATHVIGIGPASARTAPVDQMLDPHPVAANRTIGEGRVRLAESRDRTIDYRGTYWADSLHPPTPPPPSGKPRNPIANFLPDPNAARRYDEWSQQTYFDRAKRLAPTGDEPGIKEKPAITFLKLRF